MPPDRLLVLNVSGIGDFVDSTPALRALRRARPGAPIDLLVSEKAFPLAEGCPWSDRVLSIPTSKARILPPLSGLGRWSSTMLELRGRYSTVVNLYEVGSAAGALWLRALLSWIGAKETVGRDTLGRASFLSRKVADDGKPRDQLERFMEVAAAAAPGAALEKGPLQLWLPEEVFEEARRRLEAFDWGGLAGPFATVALGGERPTRHERPERAEAVLLGLQRRFGLRPVLWGASGDPGLPPGTAVRHLDARGAFELRLSAAFVACSRLVLTTHSSAQHLASVWEVPTVVLGGPGDTVTWRPHLPPRKSVLLKFPMPCAPCYYWECPLQGAERQRCLSGVSVESISDACASLLEART